MNRPKLNITILLTEKPSTYEQVETCFNQLKTYLITASDGNCTITKADFNITVSNNFLSPPTRFFLKKLPVGKELFPFDFEVKIDNSRILKAKLSFGFFWTLTYYLFLLCGCFGLTLFDMKGNIHKISNSLLFFSIPITLYFISICIVRVVLLKRKIKELLT